MSIQNALQASLLTSLSEDAKIGDAINPSHVTLTTVDFEEDDPALVFEDMTPPVTNGISTGKSAVAGPALSAIDPETGDFLLSLNSPAGGFRWETTAVPAAPESIKGYIVHDNDDNILWAKKFPNPIVIVAKDQAIVIAAPMIRVKAPTVEVVATAL
jgi:hypothetical protein